MSNVLPYQIYRHFKGTHYCVVGVALDESNPSESLVIYTSVEAEGSPMWSRKLSDFFAEIPDRPDNITGQKTRFELVKSFSHPISSFTTEALVEELRKRSDSPLYELDLEAFSDKIVSRDYMLGEVVDSDSRYDGVIVPTVINDSIEGIEAFVRNNPHRVSLRTKVFKRLTIEEPESVLSGLNKGIFDL